MDITNKDNEEPINSSQQQSLTVQNSIPQVRNYHEEIGENIIGMVRNIYENNTTRDEYSVFGEDIANSIRKLNSEYARLTVKYEIQRLLYNASLGYIDHPFTNRDILPPSYSDNNFDTTGSDCSCSLTSSSNTTDLAVSSTEDVTMNKVPDTSNKH
jgi:hypothetical protein